MLRMMRTLKGIFLPAITWIVGTIAPWFESTLGWVVQVINPVFSHVEKNEIIFYLQSISFFITILAGLRQLLKQNRKRKE